MNTNVVSFTVAEELANAGFPQEITKGQLRYTMEKERVLVGQPLTKLRLFRWSHEKGFWSPSDSFPIETKTYFAPNAKDIWLKLPSYLQPENQTEEQKLNENPDEYAVLWIDEFGQ